MRGQLDMSNIKLNIPNTVKSGEIIELKALIRHDMESGYRRDIQGDLIDRNILVLFECYFDDVLIFSADLHPGVSANPLLKFHYRAQNSGTLKFEWTEQTGRVFTKTARLTVQ